MTIRVKHPTLVCAPRTLAAGGLSSLILSAAAIAQTDCPILPAVATFTASINVPSALVHAVGDMDGDGDYDVVGSFGDVFNSMVIVYFNDGTASFTAGPSYAVPGQPRALRLAEIDGQGGLDVVTVNTESGSIAILLNPGNGALDPAGSTACGPQPTALAVGDIDDDADLDFVVANQIAAGTVSVLRNEGDGLFELAGVIPIGNRPSAVGLGRLNPDALPDLVVGYRTSDDQNALLAAMFNNGDGTFGPAIPEGGTFGLPGAVVVRDLTGDGRDEILLTTQFGTIRLLNDGFGGFKTASFDARAFVQHAVALHDVNRDSRLDLLTTMYAGGSPYGINLRLGQAGAMFGNPTLLWCDTAPESLGVADMDGDRDDDLLVGQTALFTILRSDGVRSFEGETIVGSVSNVSQFQSVDIDGDGDRDLVGGGGGSLLRITVFKNNAGFNFATPATYTLTTFGGFSDMAIVDVDGDDDKDIIARDNQDDMHVTRNNGSGVFGPATSLYSGTGGQIAAADFDDDGDIDVIVPNSDFNQPTPTTTVNFVRNDGTGAFTFAYEIPCGQSPSAVAGSDVDNDGDVDLIVGTRAWQSGNPAVSVLKNNGTGMFSNFMAAPVNGRPGRLTLGDVDRDGRDDVVVTLPTTPTGGGSNLIAVLRVAADGALAAPEYYNAWRPRFPIVRDLNGDGWPEVVCAAEGSGVRVLANRGSGAFDIAHHSSLGGGAVAVDDFDGDAQPDVLLTHQEMLGLLSHQGTFATILRQPAGVNVASGGNAVFDVGLRPTTGLGFRWHKDDSPLSDGGNISGATTDTLRVARVSAADAGLYRVVISSDHCSISSADAHLTIACGGDIAPPGGDGSVNVADMLAVISNWGPCPATCPPSCVPDVVASCNVDVNDLLAIITAWGPCQ